VFLLAFAAAVASGACKRQRAVSGADAAGDASNDGGDVSTDGGSGRRRR